MAQVVTGEPSLRQLASRPAAAISTTLIINGEKHQLGIEPWTTLLDLLRDKLDLTGIKKGCDHGQCGACTVLIDDVRINACVKLAVTLDGCAVTTIEGLGEPGSLHPLQAAFVEHDAFQCGYCTPGQICSAQGLINEGHAHTRPEVREQMSGTSAAAAPTPTSPMLCSMCWDGRRARDPLRLRTPDRLQEAIQAGSPDHAAYLAGGTNIIDLMKENVARPLEVVDINRLPFRDIRELEGVGCASGRS